MPPNVRAFTICVAKRLTSTAGVGAWFGSVRSEWPYRKRYGRAGSSDAVPRQGRFEPLFVTRPWP